MSTNSDYMLVKMEFKPKNENGIFEDGFATFKSPNPYQSQQNIDEVITIHGKGVLGFTSDDIGLDALPTGVFNDDLLRDITERIRHGTHADDAPTIDAFEDAFNAHVTRQLERAARSAINSTMESASAAHFLPTIPAVTITTPLSPQPPAEVPMTLAAERRAMVATPAIEFAILENEPLPPAHTPIGETTPVIGKSALEPSASSTAADIIDLVDSDDEPLAREPSVAAVYIKKEHFPEDVPATASESPVAPSASANSNKRSPKRRQAAATDTSAGSAESSPLATVATPPKRRFNKKLVVDDESDNESTPVELTPLALYARAAAALAEPDLVLP
jgi:hypothetical protein